MRPVASLATASLLVLMPLAASAHAFLDHAEPRVGNTVAASPREVKLWFTQKLEQAFSTIEVTDGSGQRVDTGKPHVDGNEMAVSVRASGRVAIASIGTCCRSIPIGPTAASPFTSVSKAGIGQWTGSARETNGPLIAIRAVHFAAASVTAGTLIFRTVVAKPAWGSEPVAAKVLRAQTVRVAGTALAVTVASGVLWLLSEAVSMSGLPLGEAMTPGVLWTVLTRTQFGLVSEIRMMLAIVLAACLAFDRVAAGGMAGAARSSWPDRSYRLDRPRRRNAR